MLWGKVLRSPFPHAKITNIDTAKAKAVPGVHAVITGRDLPDSRVGRLLRDMPVLARDRVRFAGEKIAAVAAETPEAAEEALLLIDVDYEELPPVFDAFAAMQSSAPVLHENMTGYEGLPQPASSINNVLAHNTWTKGDVGLGFNESDRVFEHTFTLPWAHQGYIEPHACVVTIDDQDRVQVWVNNKDPFVLRRQLAAVWDLPEERIKLNPTNIGGDFGGKGSFMDVPLCYYLALRSGRPVKMVMDYIQELIAGNPRHPATVTLKTGVKHDGRLWARQARIVFNSGAYGAFKPTVYLRGADHSGGAYRIPHVHLESFMVYTNNVPGGHMRAPAKPQVVFAVESHMDMIAREMGLDPYRFRLQNALRPGDESPVGDVWKQVRAEDTLRQAAVRAQWDSPKPRPNVGRGMAISDLAPGTGQAAATVAMDENGKATLLVPLWDTGTGAHTIFRQLVAEELTIPVEDVDLVIQDTDSVPFSSGSGGSRVTHTSGNAVLGAVRNLRQKLTAVVAEGYGCPEERVGLQAGRFIIPGASPTEAPLTEIAAQAVANARGPIYGEMTYTSSPSEVTSFCTQVAEVEVDPETGQVRVEKIVTAHDVGTVLNPMTHQGQIDGGVIQGLGYALMEEMTVEEGHVSTVSLGDYKIPTISDVPKLETVLLEEPSGPSPYQSKGIGEISNIPVAAAIANAVEDAVGVRITGLPITAEKVLRALKDRA
jgi:carbon-monoxide dehydrogenase large subunit